MNLKERIEDIQFKSYITKDLLNILGEHFQCQRCKEDITKDWWSIKHLFNEYATLHFVIDKNVMEIENELEQILKEIIKKEQE